MFAGLAVVCFRFAIEWCRIYLLGTGSTLSPTRLLLAPSLAGLVIAVLVIHVFPEGAGERSQSNQGRALHLRRLHSLSHRRRQVHHCGAGHRLGTLPRPRRSVSSDRRLRGVCPRPALASIEGANAPDRARWCRRRIGRRLQRADLGRTLRDRRGDRALDGGHPRFGRPFRGIQRRGHALVSGLRTAFQNSRRAPAASVGTHRIFRPWGRGRSGFGGILEWHWRAASAPQGAAPLDPVFSARGRRTADRAHRRTLARRR